MSKVSLFSEIKEKCGGSITLGDKAQNFECLKAISDETKLQHRRLGHINTYTMHELVSKDLDKRLLALEYKHSHSCDACIRGKLTNFYETLQLFKLSIHLD